MCWRNWSLLFGKILVSDSLGLARMNAPKLGFNKRIWGLESGGSFLREGLGPGAPDCPVVPRAKRFRVSLTCLGAQIGVLGDVDL